MKIEYLGTAACEGVPAIFCDCDTCKKARLSGGRNIRTRSQAIIDRKLLIDFPADTYIHSLNYNIELSRIHTCLITHNHEDHLYTDELINRKKDYAYPQEGPLHFYGSFPSFRALSDRIETLHLDLQVRAYAHQIQYFKPLETEGYRIIPLKANHDILCDPVIYLIQKDQKNLLYAHDSGIFPQETWSYLENHPIKLDLVSLDCTHAVNEQHRDGHMGLPSNIEVRRRLMEINCADDDTVFVTNHFSHNGTATYDEFVPVAEKENFLVAYDGMCLTF